MYIWSSFGDSQPQKGNGLVTLAWLRAPAEFSNQLTMPQVLFRGRSTAIVLHAVGIFVVATIGLYSLSAAEKEGQGGGAVKWVAPASKAQKANPVPANPASIAAGRKIFMQRCAKCHGETGKGDGPDAIDLKLHPAKFADSAIHDESDGALYWKISVGKGGMPDFAKRLSPTDRWNVINFVRTLGGR